VTTSARAAAVTPAAAAAVVPRRTNAARAVGLSIAATLMVALALASLALGSAELDLRTVVAAFTAFDGSNGHLIVLELRLPRTLVGVAVGAALALAGAVMQGVTRNPLADPGILGINAGASLAVVIAIAGLRVAEPRGYIWFALAGAALASVAVYALGAAARGGSAPLRLTLAGAVLAALLTSLTSAVLVLDTTTLDEFRFWAVGSIAGRGLDVLAAVLPFLVVGAVLALPAGRQLNALSLGEDVARSLGQRTDVVRLGLAVAVVLLAGAAVAAAGPIAFVGLAVPHAARAIVGPDYRWILPYAACLGASLILASDILGRVVARPGELQVGIMTALVGAPILVWLVRRQRLADV
jgi:iron complex transport system permease protein